MSFALVPTHQGKVQDHAVLYIPPCSHLLFGVESGVQYQYKWKPNELDYVYKESDNPERWKVSGNITWVNTSEKTSRYNISYYGPTNRHCFFGALSCLRAQVYSCGSVIDPEPPAPVIGACKRGDKYWPFIACYATNRRIDFYQYEVAEYSGQKLWVKTDSLELPENFFVSNMMYFSQDTTKAVTQCVEKKLFEASTFGLGWVRNYEYYISHQIMVNVSISGQISFTIEPSTDSIGIAYAYDAFTAKFSYAGVIASEYKGNDLVTFSINETHYVSLFDETGFAVTPRYIELPPPYGTTKQIELLEGIDPFDSSCLHGLTGYSCSYYGFTEHPPVQWVSHPTSSELVKLEVRGNFSVSEQTYAGLELPNGFRGSWQDMIWTITYDSPFAGFEPWWLHWATEITKFPTRDHEIKALPHIEEFVTRRVYSSRHRINVHSAYITVLMYHDPGTSYYTIGGYRYEAGPGWGITTENIWHEGVYVTGFSHDVYNAGTQYDHFTPFTGESNRRSIILVMDLQAGVLVLSQGDKINLYIKNDGIWELSATQSTTPIASQGTWIGFYTIDGYTNLSYDNIYPYSNTSAGLWKNSGEYASDKYGNFIMNIYNMKVLRNSSEVNNWVNIGSI